MNSKILPHWSVVFGRPCKSQFRTLKSVWHAQTSHTTIYSHLNSELIPFRHPSSSLYSYSLEVWGGVLMGLSPPEGNVADETLPPNTPRLCNLMMTKPCYRERKINIMIFPKAVSCNTGYALLFSKRESKFSRRVNFHEIGAFSEAGPVAMRLWQGLK